MIAGFVQTSPLFGDPAGNQAAVQAMAASVRADLLVLPELFQTGYSFESWEEVERYAEEPDGPTGRFLRELAALTGGVVVAGFAERSGNRFYNSAMAVNHAGIIALYRKVHLFRNEKRLFSPGDMPFPVFTHHFPEGQARIGMMICFDWAFPEAARTLALRGAQIIAHPCNLVLPWCQRAMLTRSLENRVFTVTANRIGRETRGGGDLLFPGESQVVSPMGEILIRGTQTETGIRVVSVDPAASNDKHATPENDLFLDRRPEMYIP